MFKVKGPTSIGSCVLFIVLCKEVLNLSEIQSLTVGFDLFIGSAFRRRHYSVWTSITRVKRSVKKAPSVRRLKGLKECFKTEVKFKCQNKSRIKKLQQELQLVRLHCNFLNARRRHHSEVRSY